jgi:hypothetical protein
MQSSHTSGIAPNSAASAPFGASEAQRPQGDGPRFAEALEERRNARRERAAERHAEARAERGAEAARVQKNEQSAKTAQTREERAETPQREAPEPRADARTRTNETRESSTSKTTADGAAPSAAQAVDELAQQLTAPTAAAAAKPANTQAASAPMPWLSALPQSAPDLALALELGGESFSAAQGVESNAPLASGDVASRPAEGKVEVASTRESAPKEPPVSPERAAAMLRQIRVQLHPGLREALIQLEPRELGRISIKVAVRGEAAHAELRVSKRSALEALERSLPELRAALERAGLGGGELTLQLDLSERGGREESSAPARSFRSGPVDAPLPRALVSALQRRVPSSDGVDTYA